MEHFSYMTLLKKHFLMCTVGSIVRERAPDVVAVADSQFMQHSCSSRTV
jgi:hypothetical protein